LAVGTLYTYAEKIFIPSINPIHVKKLVFTSLFWCFRYQIGTNKYLFNTLGSHPSWHTRLIAALQKLAWINNFDLDTHEPRSEYFNEVKMLLNEIIHLEHVYMLWKNIKPSESTLFGYLADEKALTVELETVKAEWDKIKVQTGRTGYARDFEHTYADDGSPNLTFLR
jgi:hypothetical protein